MMNARKLVGSAALSTLLAFLASCSTSSFMGLSKASYVEGEVQRLNQTADEIEQIKLELTEIERLAGEVEDFRRELNEVKEIEEELAEMAEQIRGRLNEMPEEVMRELVAAIEAYLSAKNDSPLNTDNPLITDK